MITSNGLKHLGFTPEVDYVLRDDGDGTYIEYWLSSSDQPTTVNIESAHTEWQVQFDAETVEKQNRLVSVKSKLEALGLTTEEVKDAFGL
tara:strand:- start:170 stop:439 length:270 start_codon:yes stop_codon:yes gene_type:complete